MAGGKKYNEDANISETGNWNVASDFSKLKIMKHLYLADEYETIATFGTSDFLEELEVTFSPDHLKMKAFRRLVKSLLMLIDNCTFAIKQKSDVEKLENHRKELKRIWDIIPGLFKAKKNNIKKTSELKILREKYDPILERVIAIKSDINKPLNKSDLLFLDKEEFDPKAHKQKMMEDLKNRG